MCPTRRPLHLLTFREALGDDLVDRRFDEPRRDPLSVAVALAVVGDQLAVVLDVGLKLLNGALQLHKLWVRVLKVPDEHLCDVELPQRLVDVPMPEVPFDANQGLKNHVAAGGLKKDASNIQKAALGDMDTASTLVRIYLFICSCYRGRLAAAAQRQSNNADPDFTDEEVLTVYVFGLIKKRSTISEIHEYVEDHFSDWFPDLPSYQSYNRRLNRLSAVFAPLVQEALSEVSCQKTRKQVVRIADSMPIMLAKGQRASQATVASDRLASVGYCSSKNTFFRGVKLHVIAQQRSGTLPLPQQAGLTPGSENDLRGWIVCNPPARATEHRGGSPLW